MPYNWVRITSSPPRERRDEVKEICRRHGGRLGENQIYYDVDGQAYALVALPADDAKQQALLAALGSSGHTGLVDADEKAAGNHPPASKH